MDNFFDLDTTKLVDELKQDYLRDKELDNLLDDVFMQRIMGKIEERRKELKKISPVYTRKYLAKKAGISISTYKNYLRGYNNGLTLRMLKRIADTLDCKPSDFFN